MKKKIFIWVFGVMLILSIMAVQVLLGIVINRVIFDHASLLLIIPFALFYGLILIKTKELADKEE